MRIGQSSRADSHIQQLRIYNPDLDVTAMIAHHAPTHTQMRPLLSRPPIPERIGGDDNAHCNCRLSSRGYVDTSKMEFMGFYLIKMHSRNQPEREADFDAVEKQARLPCSIE